ncbi:hypothetical protein C8Q80DRAFT_1316191 [Daedaleopsis nitida]|nr:hypothetical protein C8Q80DRAFT_1316191 [Daedaleopsis nitida]
MPCLLSNSPLSSTKTPVQRGARACTVCRQAKMKCVGAEDGTKRCQRCQRSGAECVFEKHRRGRKPGSKLSEASKMLRRLEKGLNNAKAKHPPSTSLSQPSSSAQYGQDDSSGPSAHPGPSNNGSHSGQQSDDDMDDDEEDRSEETLGPTWPARAIRSSIRSSFLDVVMNKEPAEHSPPHSGSPTDRLSHLSPKAPSQSPPRSHSSPQPNPYIGLFSFEPKDPVEAGIIQEADVSTYFDVFFLRLNPFINLFDPALHTPLIYPAVRRLAHEWSLVTFADGTESVETVQALACMTYWKEPADRRTWTYIGMACRMAVSLRLNRSFGVRQNSETDIQMLERRNRERTYLVLFVHDRSLSMQTGKQWMLHKDELEDIHQSWHKEGARPEIRPEDVIVAAFVHLRIIGSEATDAFYLEPNMYDLKLHKYNEKLDNWLKYWIQQMANSPLADPFHTAFLQHFQSYVKLFLNTFGLKKEISRTTPNTEAVRQCFDSACTNLQIISKQFAGTHVLLSFQRYGQESITVMSAYAAIMLLKLLRIAQLRERTEEIHTIINNTADAYQNAAHVSGSELDSAAYHARFLRRLTVMDRERLQQQQERSGLWTDGGLSSFTQGLPPIRAPQTSLGMPASQLPSYHLPRAAVQHGMNPPQLPPLTIPNSTQNMHSVPSGHVEYGMDSAMRTGLFQGGNRGPPHPAIPPASESDDSYFNYMLGEVGEGSGEGLFGRDNGTPPSGVGFMGNGSGLSDFGYAHPQSNYPPYRDQPQMHAAYGAQHNRSASFQHLPPVQYHHSNGYDGSR